MIQWTTNLPKHQMWIIDNWLNHFKTKGYETEIRKIGSHYALFIDKEITSFSNELYYYCRQHRVDNKCMSDCKYHIESPRKSWCKIKAGIETGETI
jgi:hypothetical protein